METIGGNLDSLAAFHAVAIECNFGRAADTLGASKALISKQVKQLESHLRVQLFHRTTRRVQLTEDGQVLFTYTQKVFGLIGEAAYRLRDMSQAGSGKIKFSAPVSLGEALFPYILKGLSQALPKVQFEIDLTNETRDMLRAGIDFAIRATEDHAPDVIARPLGRIRDAICVSPDFLQSEIDPKRLTTPSALSHYGCILNSHRSKWNIWCFSKDARDILVEVTGVYATNQYPMARELCLSGHGIARLPRYLVENEISSGRLIELFSDYRVSTHALYLVYLRSDYTTKKKKLTKEAIINWFIDNQRFFGEGERT